MTPHSSPDRTIVYLITAGRARDETFERDKIAVLRLISAAAAEGVAMVQIREKALNTRNLFSLTSAAAEITGDTGTRLLVNDRADVAAACGADGVHLREDSIPVRVVREVFGSKMFICASTHSAEAAAGRFAEGADAVVFSPVFSTPGKGRAAGIEVLGAVCGTAPGPVIALGGVDISNFRSVIDAGAAGFAAIRALDSEEKVRHLMQEVRRG